MKTAFAFYILAILLVISVYYLKEDIPFYIELIGYLVAGGFVLYARWIALRIK